MTFNLIVSQGRAADRTAATLVGAKMTAEALGERFGVTATSVGHPSPPAADDWTNSLSQAEATLNAVEKAVAESISSGRPTVLASNTCSISLASLPVMARCFPGSVLLWIDAHGDFHTPATTTTGYLGGMVVAAACGLWDSGHGAGLKPDDVIFIGTRDVDAEEEGLMLGAGAKILSVADATPDNLLRVLGGRRVWIHIDWDVLEPGHVPADYSVGGGLLPHQIGAMLGALTPDQVLGLELAEFRAQDHPERSRSALATIVETVGTLLARI